MKCVCVLPVLVRRPTHAFHVSTHSFRARPGRHSFREFWNACECQLCTQFTSEKWLRFPSSYNSLFYAFGLDSLVVSSCSKMFLLRISLRIWSLTAALADSSASDSIMVSRTMSPSLSFIPSSWLTVRRRLYSLTTDDVSDSEAVRKDSSWTNLWCFCWRLASRYLPPACNLSGQNLCVEWTRFTLPAIYYGTTTHRLQIWI